MCLFFFFAILFWGCEEQQSSQYEPDVDIPSPEKPDSEVRSVIFEDKGFENFCLANYDTDGDGLISIETEAPTVTKMVVNDEHGKIVSLRGIESFINLDSLFCSSLGLKALDVSKNTGLLHLSCMENQITEIDISSNVKLKNLNIIGNDIQSIDVSMLKNLRSLYCKENNISYLDVSANKDLIRVSCAPMDVDGVNVLDYLVVAPDHSAAITAPEDTRIVVSGDMIISENVFDVDYNEHEITIETISTENIEVSNIPDWMELKSCDSVDRLKNEYVFKVEKNTGEERGVYLFFNVNENVFEIVRVRQSECDIMTDPGDFVPFEDKTIETYCLENYDVDKDGGIDVGIEDVLVSSIIVHGGVGTLADISYFPFLEHLEVENTQISEINLSKNPNIKTLKLVNCYYGSTLDISENTGLETLVVRNGALNTLDLSDHVMLVKLDLSDNELVELDLSDCTRLENLRCDGNKISILDISHNAELKKELCCCPMSGSKEMEYILLKKQSQLDGIESLSISDKTIRIYEGLFSVLCDEYSIKSDGGVFSFDVYHDKGHSCRLLSGPSWVECDIVEVDDFKVSVRVEVSCNDMSDERIGKLLLGRAPDFEESISVKIVQEAVEMLPGEGDQEIFTGDDIIM